MLEMLLGVLSSAGMGTLVGLVGSIATKWLEFKMLDKKLAHEEAQAEIRLREQQAEYTHAVAMADKQIETAQVEGEIQMDIAASEVFRESLKSQQMEYGGVVDKIRGLMRPAITLFLLAVTTWYTWRLHDMVGGLDGLEPVEVVELYKHAVLTTFFLASTAVSWWFGSRWSDNKLGKGGGLMK